MSYADKLRELLPSIYRQHPITQEENKALLSLLEIIGEQLGTIESDIRQLYDNWFIETCSEWVVPYIADSIGVMGVNGVSEKTRSQRAWVANAIAYRRRKGTLLMLEQMARDATGWNSNVVEFLQHLVTTQHINHLRLGSSKVCDIRNLAMMGALGTPFNQVARNMDSREIHTGEGLYNIPNIGLFVWRLQAFPIFDAPATPVGEGKFTFSPLGKKMQLFNMPITETEINQATQEVNVPAPITRRALYENTDSYYEKNGNRSISVTVDGIDKDTKDILVCNLDDWDSADWNNRPSSESKVALDPLTGRLAFAKGVVPKKVIVSYHYGFSGEVGAGPYAGESRTGQPHYVIAKSGDQDKIKSIADAINAHLSTDMAGKTAILEITDNEIYDEPLIFHLRDKTHLIIRAKKSKVPVIKLSQPLEITTEPNALDCSVELEGLIIHAADGNIITVKGGTLSTLSMIHCTLVPEEKPSFGKSIDIQGDGSPSIRIQNSICGRISSTKRNSRVRIEAKNSIFDGKGEEPTISCYEINLENCTIFGKTNVTAVEYASNTIFTGPVKSQRIQKGCIRFSFVPTASRVPRCYKCVPAKTGLSDSHIVSENPVFTSTTYGQPGYAQLSIKNSRSILTGADNGNEMGVFNYLGLVDRMSNLRMALDEYMRFGLVAGVFFAT